MVSMLDEAEEAVPGAAKSSGDEDWVETHSSTHPSASSAAGGFDGRSNEIPEIPDLEPYPPADDYAPPAHSAIPDEPSLASLTLDDQSVHAVVGGDDDIPDLDDIPDMDDDGFGGGLMEEEDEATARPPVIAQEDDSNLLAVRTYDVMITFVTHVLHLVAGSGSRPLSCILQLRQVLSDAAGLASWLLARPSASESIRNV